MTETATGANINPADNIVPFQSENKDSLLTFKSAKESYDIGILKMQEIIGLLPVTQVPKTLLFLKDVINLHSQVIPLIDPRLKSNLLEEEYIKRTSIIVVKIKNLVNISIGIVMGSTSEVINNTAPEIKPPYSFGAAINTNYILSMPKTDNRVKILLIINQVLSTEELGAL
ncbi:MAG: hypothetical protein AMR96_04290 [Candidatus Adiutrix intracellularis]|jgi:purine-binding chemotaxis protein CheW|nr:MAG: hypothetical protein AMR96_04290 [Candidatus Adiutrix intracellularis]MDR2827471.1 chemotaxis protein CheW [Candidatus Adiutrix intracellularis]